MPVSKYTYARNTSMLHCRVVGVVRWRLMMPEEKKSIVRAHISETGNIQPGPRSFT